MPSKASNLKVAGGVTLIAVTFALIPYFATKQGSLVNKDSKLTGTQRQRGMFFSTGQDAGRDPDWDPVDHKWKGKRNNQLKPNEKQES